MRTAEKRRCACGAVVDRWGEHKAKLGLHRNEVGGLAGPQPGGYQRQWGKLFGVGLWRVSSTSALRKGSFA